MSDILPETPLGSPKPTVRVLRRDDGHVAPELAAAMAESSKLREQLADLLGRFVPSAQAGWTARVSGTVLNRLYAMAGLPPADLKRRTASPLTAYEELDLAFAAARDTIEAMAAQLAAVAAESERLRALVRDILQSMPDTADEQEWRDRAGALGVTDPDGEPYRAYTEDDL